MRYRLYKNGGVGLSHLSTRGAVLTDFISLSTTQSSADYAVQKQSADQIFTNLSAAVLTSGVVPGTSIAPCFSGDISATGSLVTSLTARTPQGTYGKVTVNAKGLVVSGSSLLASDIPNLSWSTIASGKPTTAGGYGITNALLSTGGTITGNITLHAEQPSLTTSVASKYYADTKIAVFAEPYFKPGDIVFRNTALSYAGYLRCNGGIVSKTMYAALYAASDPSMSYDSTQFKLPNLTALDSQGYGYFVKT